MKKSEISLKMVTAHNSALEEINPETKANLFGMAHAYADIMDIMNKEAGMAAGQEGEVEMTVSFRER